MPSTSSTPSWITAKRPTSFTPPCTSLTSSIPDHVPKERGRITDYFPSIKIENTQKINKSVIASGVKKRALPKQLFFDVGQPLAESCNVCGMRYSRSFDVDVALHTRFHKFYLKGITFPIKRYLRGCEMIGSVTKDHKMYRVWDGEKSSSMALLKTVEQVVELVNKEMEAAFQSREELVKLQIFVCLTENGQVIGLLVIQRISKAYIATIDDGNISIVPNSERPASLGVSRIWVRKECRRQGMAASMLSMMLNKQPSPMTRNQVAFSQPTLEGFKFACNYQRQVMNPSNECCLVFI